MEIKIYEKLPKEAIDIRESVFVKEQGFKNELDDIDDTAKHIVIFDSFLNPIATCRFFYSEERKCYVIGRVAVKKEFRGENLGSELLNFAENEIRKNEANCIELSAQEGSKLFYEKNGYLSTGDFHYDENCLHVWMRKELK